MHPEMAQTTQSALTEHKKGSVSASVRHWSFKSAPMGKDLWENSGEK